ncbi:hypothetical protein PC128_g27467 [Phytophthora cactorum]|nr:hypothetical protein PC128_g27467 [Phytophthora cactorum]
MCGAPVVWRSSFQKTVALRSTDPKYTMLAGKSLQEAEELYVGWKAMLSPLFKKMVDQGYTPQKVKSDIENKRIPGLTDEGAAAIGQLFPVYWKSVYGSKKPH